MSAERIIDQLVLPALVLVVSAGDIGRWTVVALAVVTGALMVWFVTTRHHPDTAPTTSTRSASPRANPTVSLGAGRDRRQRT